MTSLELNHKQVDKATKGQEVCVKIEPTSGETPKMFGRHFDHTDMLVSKVSHLVSRFIYTTIGELSSKIDKFLAIRSQFDSDHGVDFSASTCCQSSTFVRPLFAFYCPLFFTKKTKTNNPIQPHYYDCHCSTAD